MDKMMFGKTHSLFISWKDQLAALDSKLLFFLSSNGKRPKLENGIQTGVNGASCFVDNSFIYRPEQKRYHRSYGKKIQNKLDLLEYNLKY